MKSFYIIGKKNWKQVLPLLFSFVITAIISLQTDAATRYSVATGSWNSTATWAASSGGPSGASFPVAGDNAIIEGGLTVTVTASAACATVTIADGSTLDVAQAIAVSGTTTVGSGTSGTLTISSATGVKTFTGLVTINNGALWNETINSTATFQGGITNNGTFTANTGIHTFSINSQVLTGIFSIPSITVTGVTLTNNNTLTVATALSGTGGLTQAPGSILNIGSASAITSLDASTYSNTVNYTGGNQTVKAVNYSTLSLGVSGTKTLGAGMTTISGSLSLNGTAAATLVANLSVGGDLIIGPGTALSLSTFTANRSASGGTLTVDGTLNVGGSSGGYNAGNNFPNNFSTKNLSNGTVNYNGTGAQTISALNYNNLTISGAHGVNNVTLEASTIGVAGVFNPTATFGGGSFQIAGNTINFNSSGPQNVTAFGFYNNVTISGGNIKSTAGTTTIGGNLFVSDNNTLSVGGHNITVNGSTSIGSGFSGTITFTSTTGTKTFVGIITLYPGSNWTNNLNEGITLQGGISNNGTFTAGTGIYSFTTNPQNINGTISIPNVTVTGVTLSNFGSLTVGTALSGTGTLQQEASSFLYLGGTSAIATLDAVTFPNTVEYTVLSGAQTIKSANYDVLTLDNTSGTDLAGGPISATTLNVAAGGTLNMQGNGLTGTTTVNNLGVIRTQSTFPAFPTNLTWGGLVMYDGAAQTVSDGTYNNLTLAGTNTKVMGTGTTVINGNFVLAGTTSTTLVADLSIGGDLTIGTGTSLTLSTFLANRATPGGTLTIAGSLFVGGSSGGQSGNNFPNNYSTINFTGGLVNYNGTGAQTITAFAPNSYNNLTISGARSSSNVTLEPGTINVTGNLSTTATSLNYIITGNTVNLNGNIQTVGGSGNSSFNNLVISNTGVKSTTSTGTVTVSGTLTVNDGTTFTIAGQTVNIGTTNIGGGASGALAITSNTGTKTFTGLVTVFSNASWTNSTEGVTFQNGITNSGTFTAGTGIYLFNTNSQALTGNFSIPSVTVTGVTLTNNNILTVDSILQGTGGLTQAMNSTLNIGKTISITTLTASATGNTVNYFGAAQTVKPVTYHNLTLSVPVLKR